MAAGSCCVFYQITGRQIPRDRVL